MPLEKDPLGRKAVAYYSKAPNLLTVNDQASIEAWLQDANTKVAGSIYDVSEGLTPEYADITTRKRSAGGFKRET